MTTLKIFILSLLAMIAGQIPLQSAPRVLTTIKPVHSLAAYIMQGVGEPALILDGPESPHTYALRPSKAKLLARADIVFWIGPNLETFLQKPIQTIGASAKSVELGKTEGLTILTNRHHDNHDGSHSTTGHDHGTNDPHIWLDPLNADIMARHIEKILVNSDPDNAEIYSANTKQLHERLRTLTREIKVKLASVDRGIFFTHHDGYQYFEARFGLLSKGTLTLNPERPPGARHLLRFRQKLKAYEKFCLFTEPQLSSKAINALDSNSSARIEQLDPLGNDVEKGPELYFSLVQNMANTFFDCLSDTIK